MKYPTLKGATVTYIPKTFKIETNLAAELEKTAEKEERTMTAIVERALRAYIAQSKALSPTPEVVTDQNGA